MRVQVVLWALALGFVPSFAYGGAKGISNTLDEAEVLLEEGQARTVIRLLRDIDAGVLEKEKFAQQQIRFHRTRGMARLAVDAWFDAQQDLQLAILLQRRQVQADPDVTFDPTWQADLAKAYFGQGKCREGTSAYTQSTRRLADSVEYTLLAARCHRRAGELDKAQHVISEGLAVRPDDGELIAERRPLEPPPEPSPVVQEPEEDSLPLSAYRQVTHREIRPKVIVSPSYPLEARDAKLPPLTCNVTVFVDETGVPRRVEVKDCPDVFHATTKRAMLKSRWWPLVREGDRLAVKFTFKVTFIRDRKSQGEDQ